MRSLSISNCVAGIAVAFIAFGAAGKLESAFFAPCLKLSATEVRFGPLATGASETKTVRVSNTGMRRLRILKVTPSCGCTAASIEKSELGSQESCNLLVTMTGSEHGARTQVAIETNDITAHVRILNISLADSVPVRLSPKQFDFGRIAIPSGYRPSIEGSVVFTSKKTRWRSPQIRAVGDPRLSCTIKTVESNARRIDFDLQLVRDASPGEIAARVEVFDPVSGELLSASVRGRIAGPIASYPGAINLRSDRSGKADQETINICGEIPSAQECRIIALELVPRDARLFVKQLDSSRPASATIALQKVSTGDTRKYDIVRASLIATVEQAGNGQCKLVVPVRALIRTD